MNVNMKRYRQLPQKNRDMNEPNREYMRMAIIYSWHNICKIKITSTDEQMKHNH